MKVMDSTQVAYIFLASLSAFLSLMVVLTGLIWPEIMLAKSKPFSTIIFFISFADFCGSVMNCLGFPLKGSDMCSTQAAVGIFYFTPASWLWSLMLVYQLRTLIIFKSIHLSINWMHFLCWSVPLLPTFLPLTTNSYGQDDSQNGFVPCTLGGNPTTKFIWIDTVRTGIAFLCFFFMTIWSMEIYFYILRSDSNDNILRERKLFHSMKLYPTTLFITWFPSFLCVILINAKVLGVNSVFILVSFVISSQCGSLLAIVFFTRSSVSRLLWFNFMKRVWLSALFLCGGTTLSRLSVMEEDEKKFIQEDASGSIEFVLVTQAAFRESDRRRESLLELRDSSVTNIII